MAKNYYAILGILPTATGEEIRSAYRSRVKQFHPDIYGTNSAPFLRVQEAYEILGDPTSRNSYDRERRETGGRNTLSGQPIPIVIRPERSTPEPPPNPRRVSSLGTTFAQSSFGRYSPFFEEIYSSLWGVLGYAHAPKSDRFHAMTMEILLTRDQARRGGQVQVELPIRQSCPTCRGYGDAGSLQCLGCDGSGTIAKNLSLQVEYPPGIQDYHEIAVPLDRYGIPDVRPVLRFRISGRSEFEDML